MFKLLETFKVVYETRSFSKAAELLFVSQPTVSTHIRQLEQEISCSLFTRNGRTNIQVTPAADTLYQAALTIVENWQQVQETLQEKQLEQARLTLGVSHTFAVYLLPELLIFLYHQFPNTHFQVKQLNSWEVLQAMEHHEIDLGVIEKPLASHTVQRTLLLVDQLVLVNTSMGPWLVRETSSGVYYYTKRYFEEQNIQEPSVTIENNEIILALLKKGFGRSIVSQRAASHLAYRPLGPNYQRWFYLLHPNIQEEQSSTPYVQAILKWKKQDQRCILEEPTTPIHEKTSDD